ncbi:MAG: glycosyltransferase family 2 protein [Oscillospiraceae bacterium]|nr:glycosyltransferase family 2 protein [Oscillospiraceae bacterium]
MKISVALAAYKGEQYIAEQIDSILSQLGKNDEIIVSDDYPQGKTREIVLNRQSQDKRIKYIEGGGKGVVKNFENALNACSGDIIFLSDQDDVWLPGKVEKVTAEITAGADLVLHDASVTDAALKITNPSYFSVIGSNLSFSGNLIRNTFVGCCMAFSRQVMLDALPFPEGLPMHDWWIALVALKKRRKAVLLREPLILWRRHGGNVTGGKTSLSQKIRWRIKLILSLARIK